MLPEHSILNIGFQHCIASHIYISMRYSEEKKKKKKKTFLWSQNKTVHPKEIGILYKHAYASQSEVCIKNYCWGK